MLQRLRIAHVVVLVIQGNHTLIVKQIQQVFGHIADQGRKLGTLAFGHPRNVTRRIEQQHEGNLLLIKQLERRHHLLIHPLLMARKKRLPLGQRFALRSDLVDEPVEGLLGLRHRRRTTGRGDPDHGCGGCGRHRSGACGVTFLLRFFHLICSLTDLLQVDDRSANSFWSCESRWRDSTRQHLPAATAFASQATQADLFI